MIGSFFVQGLYFTYAYCSQLSPLLRNITRPSQLRSPRSKLCAGIMNSIFAIILFSSCFDVVVHDQTLSVWDLNLVARCPHNYRHRHRLLLKIPCLVNSMQTRRPCPPNHGKIHVFRCVFSPAPFSSRHLLYAYINGTNAFNQI